MSDKLAGSRWRSAENLLKLIKSVEKQKGYSLASSSGGYNRHKALEIAAKHMGLDKTIGQGYNDFADKLKWGPIPEKLKQNILGSHFNHETPKYIFRGITPGKNIADPFKFDNAGLSANFLHGSPSFGSAAHYSKTFGPGRGNEVYQVFKPTKDQAYMPDFTAVNFVDKATGKLTSNAERLTWDKQIPFLKQHANAIEKEHPGRFDAPTKAYTAFKDLVYETPVFPKNKTLGTFLTRLKPSDSSSDFSILGQTKTLLDRAEVARIPNSLKNKAIQMALENQKQIYPVKQASERVRVVMPYKGQYLMETLNNPKWPDNLGKRRFVGGGVEEGETPEQAAARELFEELGIKINPKRFKHLGLDTAEKTPMHYLQLQRHGLKPGEYKSTAGSDPIIYLNKGIPAGSDYLGADLASLLKRSDWQVPSKQQLDSPSITPKSPAPIKPLPTKAPAMPLKTNTANLQYNTTMPASPAARTNTLNIPGGYYNAGTQANTASAAEYSQAATQNNQNATIRNKVMEDWLSSNYSKADVGGFGANRLAAHEAIAGNIQRMPEYYSNTKALADMARERRMATPHRTLAPSPQLSAGGSYGQTRKNVTQSRDVYVVPQEHRSADEERPAGWNPYITEIHEREHAGAQRVDPNADDLTNTFQFETPAVLAELANSAQAAYDAGSGKPLQGNFTITPSSAKPFNVPLETLRREAYRRGHTGGQGNVSMTEMLNSPEGQEFIRMNLRRAEFAERERMKQQNAQ